MEVHQLCPEEYADLVVEVESSGDFAVSMY